ncbi:MAG: DUF3108 domain-containing protein [Verrucomicrobiales bacterium]|nr:DUF3108 domain-containing protein [Verrucomicrobiales bacterium]
MKPSFLFPLLLAGLLHFPPTAKSEEGPPSWMKNVTRLPPGDHAILRPVKLEYTLSWNNKVNAGEFEIAVTKRGSKNTKFIGDAQGRSTGFARVLWPYDFRARSIIDEASLRPITFQLTEQERNEQSSYDIIFDNRKQLYTTTSKKKNEAERTATSRFKFDFGQDALSSAFYLRTQPLEDGDELNMVVTPFNKPYLAQFRVMGREKRKIKGKSYQTIKLAARVAKINTDLSLKHYDKIKTTTLWIIDDKYRLPVELQSDISLGFVSARLRDTEWLD